MNKNHQWIAIVAISVLLSSSATYLLTWNMIHVHRDPRPVGNVLVFYEGYHTSYQIPSGNLITNIGERYVRNILGWDNETNMNATQWISVSNDATPLVTWTELPNEVAANGFTRAANDTCSAWNNGTDYAYNVTLQFTATGSQQLQCAGLQWSGQSQSNNNLFAAATFTQTTFSSGENLTVTWVITYDAN